MKWLMCITISVVDSVSGDYYMYRYTLRPCSIIHGDLMADTSALNGIMHIYSIWYIRAIYVLYKPTPCSELLYGESPKGIKYVAYGNNIGIMYDRTLIFARRFDYFLLPNSHWEDGLLCNTNRSFLDIKQKRLSTATCQRWRYRRCVHPC